MNELTLFDMPETASHHCTLQGRCSCGRFSIPSQPLLHQGDPPTSRKAAEKAANPERLSVMQLRVLGNLYYARLHDQPGLSDWEHHGVLPTTAGKRRLALQRALLVDNTGLEIQNPNGSLVAVWAINADGVRAYLQATRAAA